MNYGEAKFLLSESPAEGGIQSPCALQNSQLGRDWKAT